MIGKRINDYYTFYGGEDPGLKVQDLIDHQNLIFKTGLKLVPNSHVICAEIFDRICKEHDLRENTYKQVEDYFELLNVTDISELLEINIAIVSTFEKNVPICVRSSSRGDQGGIGIFDSYFMVPTGDQSIDLNALWELEKKVYLSEFSQSAIFFKMKHNLPFGMAIFIQNVIGEMGGHGTSMDDIEWFFYPDLSGCAYSDYDSNGNKRVKAVTGLGTNAVLGKVGAITEPFLDPFSFGEYLWKTLNIDAISLKQGSSVKIEKDKSRKKLGFGATDCDPLIKLFEILSDLAKHGSYYLEWAIKGQDIYVVQFNPHDKEQVNKEQVRIHIPENFVLSGKSNDIVNFGHAESDTFVMVYKNSISIGELHYLYLLNEQHPGFVLAIDQSAFSTGTYESKRLKYEDFYNASGVVEISYELSEIEIYHNLQNQMALGEKSYLSVKSHSSCGAEHFLTICKKDNILFQAIDMKSLNFPKFQSIPVGNVNGITLWKVKVIMINNPETGTGELYFGENLLQYDMPVYSFNDIERFTIVIRQLANEIYNDKSYNELSNNLYMLSCLIAGGNIENPTKVDDEIVDELGGIAQAIKLIRLVINNGILESIEDLTLKHQIPIYLEYLIDQLENELQL